MKNETKGRQFNIEENVHSTSDYLTDNGTVIVDDSSLKAIFSQTEISAPSNLFERVEEGYNTFHVSTLSCQSAQNMLEDYADSALDEVNAFLVCEHISICQKCAYELQNIELSRAIFTETAIDAPEKIAEIVYAEVATEIERVNISAKLFKKTEIEPLGVNETFYAQLEIELANNENLAAMFKQAEITPPTTLKEKVFEKRPNVLYLRVLKTASVAAIFALAILGFNTLANKNTNTEQVPKTTASVPIDNTPAGDIVVSDEGKVAITSPEVVNNTPSKPNKNKQDSSTAREEKAQNRKSGVVVTTVAKRPTTGGRTEPNQTGAPVSTPQITVQETTRQKDNVTPSNERGTVATIHREDRTTVVASNAKDKFNSSTNVVKVSSADDAQARYAEEANRELAKGVDKSQYLL